MTMEKIFIYTYKLCVLGYIGYLCELYIMNDISIRVLKGFGIFSLSVSLIVLYIAKSSLTTKETLNLMYIDIFLLCTMFLIH